MDKDYYSSIVELVNLAQFSTEQMLHSISDTMFIWDNIDITDKDIITSKFSGVMIGAYNYIFNNQVFDTNMVELVSGLQSYIVDKYGTLDNYYDTTGLTVSEPFVTISFVSGYPIKEQYIGE